MCRLRRSSALALVLLVAVLAACGPGRAASPSTALGRIEGIAVAGPTCPVVTDPPQSGCEARPVGGATLLIVDAGGSQVATATTGDDGRFQVEVAPGSYEVRPQPVEGLMGTAPDVSVTVGLGNPARVTVSYDTGIR